MSNIASIEAPKFVEFDAQRWDLYVGRPGATEAAADLTQSFNGLAAKAFMAMAANTPPYQAIADLRSEMEKVMSKYSDLGAVDSSYSLDTALRRVFGDELQTLGAVKRPRPGV